MYYISWRFYKAKLMKKCWKQQKYRHRHKHTNERLRSLHIAFFRSNSSQKSIYIISVRCSLSQRWSYSAYMFFRLSYTCIYSSYFDFVYFSHWIPLLMLLFFRFSLFIIILRIMCLSRIIGYFPIPGVSDYVKLAIAVIDFQLN